MKCRNFLDEKFKELPKFVQDHSFKVGEYLQLFLQEISLRKCKGLLAKTVGLLSQNDIFLLGKYHDIGKIGVSHKIWEFTGTLNESERHIIRTHTMIGASIVRSELTRYALEDSDTNYSELLQQCCLYHHERWDGTGYPYGLRGEEIPEIARIIAIVDSFEAMIEDRPYHKQISIQLALQEIQDCSGTQFDPIFAELFLTWAAEYFLKSPAL